MLPVPETAVGADLHHCLGSANLQGHVHPSTGASVFDAGEQRVRDQIAKAGGVRFDQQRLRPALRDLDCSAPHIVGKELDGAARGGGEVRGQVLGDGKLAERAEQRVDAADSVAQRRDVFLHPGVSRALRRFELLGQQLQVQCHVVQRILSLVREADGEALEQADPIAGPPLDVLFGWRGNPRNRMPHLRDASHAQGAHSCAAAKRRNLRSGAVFTAQRNWCQVGSGELKRARRTPARSAPCTPRCRRRYGMM